MLSFFSVAAVTCTKPFFFFFPPWWEYLKTKPDELGQCAPVFTPPGDFWLVGLAVLDILLRVTSFIALLSLLIAGIEYIVAVGNPQSITNARKRAVNSLVGIAIAFSATLVVSFVGRQFG